MRRWLKTSALIGAGLLCANLVSAQSSRSNRDDNGDEEDIPNFALSVGVGLIEPAHHTETYYMAALRIRFARGDEDEQGARGGRRDRGIQGYLEPEVGYWKSTDPIIKGTDTLVGVNLVGSFPFAAAETFLGVGVGAHFIDSELLEGNTNLNGTETKLGVNAQFGIDLNLGRHLSVFGASRIDLVQGARDDVQSKIYLGVRGRF